MDYFILSLFIIALGACNNTSPKKISTPICPPDWYAADKELTQKQLNDSTEQLFLNDTLWFEVIGKTPYNAEQETYTSYLKLYRTNGLLEAEGYAIYHEHPILDFTETGQWTYYDCIEKLDYIQEWN